ncbi:MAG: polyamine aminopropyltransferase [Synergistaceae bacterium]|jgi:spermidine synthase|nr:polyamine aminopropyltransferase [Synergistaceae bacterium]
MNQNQETDGAPRRANPEGPPEAGGGISDFNPGFLLFATLVISICSVVYELLIGSLSSYLLGDGVLQFSLTIGLYLFAMGLGSWVSKQFVRDLFDVFVLVEAAVGLAGGFSSMTLFLCYLHTKSYPLVMYLLTVLIGGLVGLEIPLLVRILDQERLSLRSGVASVFAFDYLGGLFGSLLFPLVLLPSLGYVTTAFFTGVLNFAAAVGVVFRYPTRLVHRRGLRAVVCAGFLLLLGFTFAGDAMTTSLEGGLYRDQVILSLQTRWQKVVLTKHKDDLRLFIDGNVQFSSLDEYRYHEALVHVPLAARPDASRVLLLGAGDGLAARELLKYPNIREITLVDIDEALVNLCRQNPLIAALNRGSLEDSRIHCVFEDAFSFLRSNEEPYDVILADLPDPNNEALNKLYTTAFYQMARRNLTPGGVMATQSGSPCYTGDAFWCINKTLGEAFPLVLPYHLYVPSFGDWGFNLALSSSGLPDFVFPEGLPLSWLSRENFQTLFAFAKDERRNLEDIAVNTLLRPRLLRYYAEGTDAW